MNLADQDYIIAMQLASQGESIMLVSEKGIGKCTLTSEFPTKHRGTKGVKCYKITEKTGQLVGAKAVNKDDQVMLINTEGIVIRIRVNETALSSRITSGVKLIDLKDNEVVASIAKVRKDVIMNEEEAAAEDQSEASQEETSDSEETK
jgi:DNA gyrase subunit A